MTLRVNIICPWFEIEPYTSRMRTTRRALWLLYQQWRTQKI